MIGDVAVAIRSGVIVRVDQENAPLVEGYAWYIDKGGYVARKSHGKTVFLHRVIVGAVRGQLIDHRNRDRLDNTRRNLRLATPSGNAANRTKSSGTLSGFKGVTRHVGGRWQAACGERYLGLFDSEEAAAHAYDQRALELYGDFACLNFPATGARSA